MNWYDTLEPNIRAVVKLLRDNGFNTFCSCEHTMEVEMECYDSNEIDKLYNLLIEHGFTTFTITTLWEVGILNKRNIVLSLHGKELKP